MKASCLLLCCTTRVSSLPHHIIFASLLLSPSVLLPPRFQWSPVGVWLLAVGCSTGLCLWRMVPDKGAKDRRVPELVFVQTHAPVSAIQFDPSGLRLACAIGDR